MEAENPNERPRSPPGESEGSSTRWIIAVFATALLGLGGYRGYHWWVADLERQGVAAVEVQENVAAPASASAESTPATSGKDAVRPGEPLPPAVIGARIHKCIVNGHVTYTNEACPAGATDEPASVTASLLSAGDRPSQREAACRFLAAEISRLNYEFQQMLPPPVLDEIASDLKGRREQAAHLNCSAAQTGVVAPKAVSKVIQEKAKP